MFDMPALLFRLWLPVIAIWMTSSALIALGFERVMNAEPGDGAQLELNVWLVIAAQGAGAGGLLGTFPVLHQLVAAANGGEEMGRLLLYIGVGTVCGAACSCALVAAVVEIWRR